MYWKDDYLIDTNLYDSENDSDNSTSNVEIIHIYNLDRKIHYSGVYL